MSDEDQLIAVLQKMVTADASTLEIVKLVRDRHDDELAELRDELHALANRVENLTRAVTTEQVGPQSFVCRVNPGCNEQHRPHVHHDDGSLIYVPEEEDVTRYYAERNVRAKILREHRG